MAAKLLLISSKTEDQVVWRAVANVNHLELAVASNLEDVVKAVESERQLVVIWDCDQTDSVIAIGEVLIRWVNPMRVFAVTDKPLNTYKEIFRVPAFAHHLIRRYESPGPILFSKIVLAATIPYAFGLERFLPAGTAVQRVTLKKSTQKAAAIAAVDSVLQRQSVTPRLAILASQAVDELIMNAVFDAPLGKDGKPSKRNIPRDADFPLLMDEEVILSMADAREYFAIQIADPFGSLDKGTVLRFLRQDFQAGAYNPNTSDKGAGLGLHGIIQSGLSLLFVSRPGIRTEVTLFIKKAETFKEFREGFRFVSIMSP